MFRHQHGFELQYVSGARKPSVSCTVYTLLSLSCTQLAEFTTVQNSHAASSVTAERTCPESIIEAGG